MRRYYLLIIGAIALNLSGVCTTPAVEYTISTDDLKNLEAFEAASLNKADKAYNDKDYKRAAVEYEAFTQEFPKSPAIAYALMRMARCEQLSHKLNKAIKEFTDVVKFYPDAVNYAGAAQYYVGLCHEENGDPDSAVREWRKLVDDPRYLTHPFAALAINQLAESYEKTGQGGKSAEMYEKVAVGFRDRNRDAANKAVDQVIRYYVLLAPNEAKLRAFYTAARGFDDHPLNKLPEDVGTDKRYWDHIRKNIEALGRFDLKKEGEAERKARFYKYWADAMEGKLLDWDDFQIDFAAYRLAADGDLSRWIERLDQQYQRAKSSDASRTIKWIQLLAEQKAKVAEYLAKLDLDKLDSLQLERLMRIAFAEAKDAKLGRTVFEKIALDKLDDRKRQQLAQFLMAYDGELVEEVCLRMEDKELGKFELLRFHHSRHGEPGHDDKALLLAGELAASASYGRRALWMKAEVCHWAGKYAEAIKAYGQSETLPESLFRIAECWQAQGKTEQAVASLKEVEASYKNRAADACLRVARLYGKDEKEYIKRLRLVVSKYPNSAEQSTAHQELERLHAPIGGAVIHE